MLRPTIHILLHLLVPALAARIGFKNQWKQAWAVMVLTMMVDVDHLWATPLYVPDRCSIGFHPFHTVPAIIFYGILMAIPVSRVVGTGLVIHMALDALDCFWMRI